MTTVASAPGKVLLAGGYLVLQREYECLTVSTTARFYASVSSTPASASASSSSPEISILSPQFDDPARTYDSQGLPLSAAQPPNKFLDTAILQLVRLCTAIRPGWAHPSDLGIKIVADNDFYSQRATLSARGLPVCSESLRLLPPFAKFGTPIAQVHKTGLGSSAALVVSLVSAVLVHLEFFTLERRETLHNISQYIHCLAQGKVGSGFDVSSAVWGTHLYRRFSPSVLDLKSICGSDDILSIVNNAAWDNEAHSFPWPRGIKLSLADVDAGSDTPSMVSKVHAWRANNVERAREIYEDLNKHNMRLASQLKILASLSDAQEEVYDAVLLWLSSRLNAAWDGPVSLPAAERELIAVFCRMRDAFSGMRANLRTLGELADVPIEPPQQTQLLHACITNNPGVIGGVVPGAGGLDAICILTVNSGSSIKDPITAVETIWSEWADMSVCALNAQADASAQGVTLIKIQDVKGLKDAFNVTKVQQ